MKNFILIQIKCPYTERTITTLNGTENQAFLLKNYITDIFTNETGGMTIWIEITACDIEE